MTMRYWAIRPKEYPVQYTRIEKAATSYEACRLAFGPPGNPANYIAKDLGTRVAVIHSDKKRIALLTDPNNWVPLSRV